MPSASRVAHAGLAFASPVSEAAVDAARLAVSRAGGRAAGAVAVSDAFFPFPDGLEVLLDAGVRAVAHPGGSIRDAEVTAAAEGAGVPLYLTGTRHFTH